MGFKGTDSGKSTKGDSTNGDAEDGKFKRKLLFFLYGCLNIFRLVSGLSWEPMVMWRALRHIKNTNYELQLEVKALDCLDWSELADFLAYVSVSRIDNFIAWW
ncbi:hypothetical protein V6N13_022814 [Hibiscus sabdariffa]